MHQQKLSRPLQLALDMRVKPNLRISSCTAICAAVQRPWQGALEQMLCSDRGKEEGAEKQTGQEPQVLLSMVNSGKHQAHFQDG